MRTRKRHHPAGPRVLLCLIAASVSGCAGGFQAARETAVSAIDQVERVYDAVMETVGLGEPKPPSSEDDKPDQAERKDAAP